ncbi:hypothetical protein ABZ816_37045 [Actinosynnema sp. NPDC047251]|uniref:hypothetical protein n=1 Tax=Saccharothrix espanaensis TaxID=103731 RepID=UPI00031F391B|nr:hypothetical protein [Saccharothrix espanaensis]
MTGFPLAPQDWVVEDTGSGLVVARAHLPADVAGLVVDDLTSHLGQWFDHVLPVDVDTAPAGLPSGSVRALHCMIDRRGRGIALETAASPDRDGTSATCWTSTVGDYARDRDTARRVVAGRPARPPQRDDMPCGLPFHARLVLRRDTGTDEITLMGKGNEVDVDDGTGPVPTPVDHVPRMLVELLAIAPRPRPTSDAFVVTNPDALTRLLDSDPADADAARAVLAAPRLADEVAADLAALARGVASRWALEWVRDGLPLRRIDIVDAGDAGLWSVRADVPPLFAAELGEDVTPIMLGRVGPAEVFRELTLLSA